MSVSTYTYDYFDFLHRFHHQALVELKILDVIKRKDKDNLHNVIHMKEYFYFRNHLCISFELLGFVYLLGSCIQASPTCSESTI